MPKPKAKKQSDSSDSDSGPEDRGPAKKQKVEPEEDSWEIGNKRFVKLTEFKGKWYINIREYYDAGGELKPGKRGIMLNMEQWHKFKGIVSDIEDAVKRRV